jgi:hypothetical protein
MELALAAEDFVLAVVVTAKATAAAKEAGAAVVAIAVVAAAVAKAVPPQEQLMASLHLDLKRLSAGGQLQLTD